MSTTAYERYADAFASGMQRDERQTVSEWADEFRFLSNVSSAEPGRWRTSRTPYLKAVMDALSIDSGYTRVVMMAGAQVGKTECGNNWLGHIIHRTPGPILFVEPTLDSVKKVSRQRITPMIESSPVLAARVRDPRSRDSGNTVQVKTFKGGLLVMTGANSAAGLRSMPIRFLFMDEVDEYPGDIEGQGDPIAVAEKRTSTYSRRKVFLTSTPTIRGVSRIEREFLASDQQRFFIPCPACGHMDWIQWSAGGWRANEGVHHHMVWVGRDYSSIRMKCPACAAETSENHKTAMLAAGEWRPTAPGDGVTIGFHISGLYSPLGWRSWSECLREFMDSKEDPFRLKTWVNTVLGETWEDAGDALEAPLLKARLKAYAAEVPHGAGIMVGAVDVQADRLEAQIVAFGDRERSWLIDFAQLQGDPSQVAVWGKLDEFLNQSFKHESGRMLKIETAVIDSGGAHTEDVYRYVATRHPKRIAIKGGSFAGRPLVERPSNRNRYRIPLFVLCVDTGKDVVVGRLQMHSDGPGYIHLPEWVDDEYLEQLTAERAIRKYVPGRGSVRVWTKVKTRNEALDLTVYSLAALYILGHATVKSLSERAQAWSAPPEQKPEETAMPKRRGWVSRW